MPNKRRSLPKVSRYGQGYSFRYTDADGRQRRHPTLPSEQEALAARNQIYADLASELPAQAASPAAQQTLEQRGLRLIDESHGIAVHWRETQRGYLENHIIPAIGHYTFEELASWPSDRKNLIQAYVDAKSGHTQEPPPVRRAEDGTPIAGLAEVLSPQSIHHHLNLLSKIFSQVERESDRRVQNPIPLIERPKLEVPKVTPLEPETIQQLLELFEDGPRVLVLLMVSLGLRVGEALGFPLEDHIPDIDPESGEGLVIVRQAVKRGDRKAGQAGTILGSPKSRSGSYRISQSLNRLLCEQRARIADCPNPQGLMFPTQGRKTGIPTASNFHSRHWTPALLSLAVKHLRPEELDRVSRKLSTDLAVLVRLLAVCPALTLRTALALQYTALREGHLSYLDTRGRQRVDPLPPHLVSDIEEYYAVVSATRSKRCQRQPLFPGTSARSKHVALSSVVTAIKAALNAEDLRPGTTPHGLRHTFASEAIRGGASALQVAALIRHSERSGGNYTTGRYIHQFKAQEEAAADTAGLYLEDE